MVRGWQTHEKNGRRGWDHGWDRPSKQWSKVQHAWDVRVHVSATPLFERAWDPVNPEPKRSLHVPVRVPNNNNNNNKIPNQRIRTSARAIGHDGGWRQCIVAFLLLHPALLTKLLLGPAQPISIARKCDCFVCSECLAIDACAGAAQPRVKARTRNGLLLLLPISPK